MNGQFLIDTGPLVSLIDRSQRGYEWSYAVFEALPRPLLTCEPVITEACFLLSNIYGGESTVMAMVGSRDLRIAFALNEYAEDINSLMTRYDSVPMSLADACLVKMAELHRNSTVVTMDSDFKIYRKHRNQMIPLIMPDA